MSSSYSSSENRERSRSLTPSVSSSPKSYENKFQEIVKKEKSKKKMKNKDFLIQKKQDKKEKTLVNKLEKKTKESLKPKEEIRKIKCDYCGLILNKKSFAFHSTTKHGGKGLTQYENFCAYLEYSKRRMKKISILIDDIDKISTKCKLSGKKFADNEVLENNLKNIKKSIYNICKLNKKK